MASIWPAGSKRGWQDDYHRHNPWITPTLKFNKHESGGLSMINKLGGAISSCTTGEYILFYFTLTWAHTCLLRESSLKTSRKIILIEHLFDLIRAIHRQMSSIITLKKQCLLMDCRCETKLLD